MIDPSSLVFISYDKKEISWQGWVTYDHIVHQNESSNDERLANFKTIQTSIDVYTIGAENS